MLSEEAIIPAGFWPNASRIEKVIEPSCARFDVGTSFYVGRTTGDWSAGRKRMPATFRTPPQMVEGLSQEAIGAQEVSGRS